MFIVLRKKLEWKLFQIVKTIPWRHFLRHRRHDEKGRNFSILRLSKGDGFYFEEFWLFHLIREGTIGIPLILTTMGYAFPVVFHTVISPVTSVAWLSPFLEHCWHYYANVLTTARAANIGNEYTSTIDYQYLTLCNKRNHRAIC